MQKGIKIIIKISNSFTRLVSFSKAQCSFFGERRDVRQLSAIRKVT